MSNFSMGAFVFVGEGRVGNTTGMTEQEGEGMVVLGTRLVSFLCLGASLAEGQEGAVVAVGIVLTLSEVCGVSVSVCCCVQGKDFAEFAAQHV